MSGTRGRAYLETHPWMTFELHLEKAHPTLWMLLGEAASKCEHLAGVPLQPSVAAEMHKLFLAKGALASSAIEGNTLSEQDVLDLLDKKLKLPPSKEYLAREVNNIVVAANRIIKGEFSVQVDVATLRTFNRLVLDGLELQDEVEPGVLRNHRIGVGSYRAPLPEDCPYLLDRFCEWLRQIDEDSRVYGEAYSVHFAILRAVFAHLYFVWIHPFGDGNGRTARLLELFILLNAGVPTPAAHLLSNHYNETRSKYYLELEKASKRSDVLGFATYAVQGFVEQIRQQIEQVKQQQFRVAWKDFIGSRFDSRPSAAQIRRKKLVLELTSSWPTPVAQAKMLDSLPRLALEYSSKTMKTLSRDLNSLVTMGLLVREGGGYRARYEIMAAFLPMRKAGAKPG